MQNERSTLFKGTAWYYARFRPGYPEALFSYIRDRFRLDRQDWLLDLGCGTGQLAIPLAKNFEEVVGIDPEREMLAEARVLAKRDGIGNITWIQGTSSHMNLRFGEFRVVTMGSSFHWMDRDSTLKTLWDMLVPQGGIVVVSDRSSIWAPTNAWRATVKKVIQRWLGEARRAGNSIYLDPPERHEQIIARSQFKRMEVHEISHLRFWDIESITGFLYSTSFCSPRLLGNNRAGFERDLKAALLELDSRGRFTEKVTTEAILAWKN